MGHDATRRARAVVADWWPLAVFVAAYLLLHELTDVLAPRAHVDPQLAFDEFVFDGVAPTVRLQRALWDPARLRWYDYAAWAVYLSHFVVSLTVALVLWWRDHPRFRPFRDLFFLVTFAGFATYVIYPAIPPWLAGLHGDMPTTTRIIPAIWTDLGVPGLARAFGEQSEVAFPTGALPSLHAAWPLILAVFFWRTAGWWRVLLVAYVVAMATTLVYTADHFVFDVLLGWAYVVVACIALRAIRRRRADRATGAQAAPLSVGSG